MAKILRIHSDNPQENHLNEVIKTLNNGGLIIYPSDTVYALGCDIYNVKAMEKLARLKNTSLEKALDQLCISVDRAYASGTNIVILSDRGVDENHVAIPSLLAVCPQDSVSLRRPVC